MVVLGPDDLLAVTGMELLSNSSANSYRRFLTPIITAAREVDKTFSGATRIRTSISLRGGSSMTRFGLPANDIDVSMRLQVSTSKRLKSEDLTKVFMATVFSRYLIRVIKRIRINKEFSRGYLHTDAGRFYWNTDNIGDPWRESAGLPLLDDLNLSSLKISVANIVVILPAFFHMRYIDLPVRITALESRDSVGTMQPTMAFSFGHVYFDKASARFSRRSERIVQENLVHSGSGQDYLSLVQDECDSFARRGAYVTALRRCALLAAYTRNKKLICELRQLFSQPAVCARHLGKRLANVGKLLNFGIVGVSEALTARELICCDISAWSCALDSAGELGEANELRSLVESISALDWRNGFSWPVLLTITGEMKVGVEHRLRSTLHRSECRILFRVGELLGRRPQ